MPETEQAPERTPILCIIYRDGYVQWRGYFTPDPNAATYEIVKVEYRTKLLSGGWGRWNTEYVPNMLLDNVHITPRHYDNPQMWDTRIRAALYRNLNRSTS